jgi:hypothetical protein
LSKAKIIIWRLRVSRVLTQLKRLVELRREVERRFRINTGKGGTPSLPCQRGKPMDKGMEELVEKRLDDMGLDGDRPHSPELRAAARAYCLGLIREDIENSTQVTLSEALDSAEGMTLGFVAGYEACLNTRES